MINQTNRQIRISSNALIELTRRLQEYISKVERASRLVKKARFIAGKIRQGTHMAETNFSELTERYYYSGIKAQSNLLVKKFDTNFIIEEGKFNNILLEIQNGRESVRFPFPVRLPR